MESERCDTGGLPSLDLPADAPLIVQCFKGSDGESCELRPSTLASTALLQHVLEAGTRPRHSQGSPSSYRRFVSATAQSRHYSCGARSFC
jgi:hypothetical protein